MMKIYLAARFSRYDEMQGVRDVLQAMGHEITSRWIDLHGGEALEAASFELLDREPAAVAHFAEHDIADILAADQVWVFTSTDPSATGGHHVELGFALGVGIPLVVIGPRTNVFHALPKITHYSDWSTAARAIAPRVPCPAGRGVGMIDSAFQAEVNEWSARNFGAELPQTLVTLGLAEEVGELCRAVLKREQGIRGSREEWDVEIRKELGDCVIKLLDIAAREGIELTDVVQARWDSVKERNWVVDRNGHGLPA